MGITTVKVVKVLGNDLTVANSARVSYLKKSDKLSDKDKGLIRFLAREGHMSPFRHVVFRLHVHATGLDQYHIEHFMEHIGSQITRRGEISLDGWVDWKWTVSLQALAHFVLEFIDSEDIEDRITLGSIAKQCGDILLKEVPLSAEQLLKVEVH